MMQPRITLRPVGLERIAFWCLIVAAAMVMLAGGGCASSEEAPPERDPGPTYTGPVYLRGTIGSLARVRGFEPLPVAGYGLVVNLRGTGSSEVPAAVRQYMLNHLRRIGVGQSDSPLPNTPPEQVLDSPNTAVVLVQGLIPPGASRGGRFDLLVRAADTQTTSLAGGSLWPVDLSIGGQNPGVDTRLLAKGEGPLYLDPFANRAEDDQGEAGDMGDVDEEDVDDNSATREGFARRGVVLAGGRALTNRNLELILNQASYRRSRLIEQRINERYPAAPRDSRPTAEAVSDSRIRINIPQRWQGKPGELLRLIEHLYLDRSPGFIPHQARTLANVLRERPDEVERITLAWRSLGPNAVPELRDLYQEEDLTLRLAALRAGAFLEDERAGIVLSDMADHPDPMARVQVARSLLHLPRSLRGSSTLGELLDDEDTDVRLAAYDAMAAINDPMIDRVPVGNQRLKFVLDRVPSEKPLIYVTHERRPRLAVFDPGIVFDQPMLTRLWDNRLMLRVNEPRAPLTVFYQKPGEVAGETYQLRPDLATLIFFLAHEPTDRLPQPGLGLSYSEVVNIVHELTRRGVIDAPFEAEINPLAAQVARAQRDYQTGRPEVTPLNPDADLEGPPALGEE
ncbi:MAG: flagellar basal body P-ring protein FlgI [Phycisphaeraceae bacterium]